MASATQRRTKEQAVQADGLTTAPAGPTAAAAAQGPPKARLRGAIHHYAVFVALAVGILLILDAQSPRARWGCVVYTASTVAMFGASALYHRPTWQPAARQLMRRLDHAAIFLLIAGTNTPLALVALEPAQVGDPGAVGGAGLWVARCWVSVGKAVLPRLHLLLHLTC
jgi:hemolysin III